jgi:hypothetical protein
MGEAASTIFTILLFIAAFLGSGAYAVLSLADFRAARGGFWATAISFAAIGIVLGIMTTWPLPVRMIVCAAFFAMAGGGLIWILDYLNARQALGIGSSEQSTLQPNLALKLTTKAYELKWGPPTGRLFSDAVQFLLKNEAPSVVASRVEIVWRSETSIEAVKEIVLRDSKITPFNPKIGNRRIVLNPRPDGGNLLESEYPWSESDGDTLAILATEEAILLPPSVQFPALFYFIATMPKEIGKTTAPYLVSVTIKWQHPPGGLEQKFRVKMTATNTNPDVDSRYVIAHLNFEVEKIN